MSNTRGNENKQILFLEANDVDGASDYIVADIHGSQEVLSDLLALLTEDGDRLFLLGDLVDRGDDNVEVIKTLASYKNATDVSVFSILGNHEKMCIDTINAMNRLIAMKLTCTKMNTYLKILYHEDSEQFTKLTENYEFISIFHELFDDEMKIDLDKLDIEKDYLQIANEELSDVNSKYAYYVWLWQCNNIIDQLDMHVENGGEWLMDLYIDEFYQKKIHAIVRDANEVEVVYNSDSDVSVIYEYMSDLPTVIRVNASDTVRAFNAVHADMPVSDKKLQKLYDAGKRLDEDRHDYAIWARSHEYGGDRLIDNINGRTGSSIITYTGHSPYDGVRADTNTVNLDVASTFSKKALVVNHTKMECIVTNVPYDEERKMYVTGDEDLDKVFNETQKLLDAQRPKQQKTKKKKSTTGANLFASVVDSEKNSNVGKSGIPKPRIAKKP
ncbi:MAG TPA: metallophosphoesterase [Gammaproteobacteria bacterium]|jgi:hypothetical protein|nr:metallophosphoesterase [Gammaproteobacteria bacterium]